MEGSWEAIAGCAWRVCMLWVDAMYSCYCMSMTNLICLCAETVISAVSVWYVGICCEILLLLNVAESDMDCLLPGMWKAVE